jgi:hypothetical protein
MRTVVISLLLTALCTVFAPALPEKTHVTQYISTDEGLFFGISREKGFVVSDDGGTTWNAKNRGLPLQVAYPFTAANPVPLTSIAADPSNTDRIAVTSYWGLYVSENRGEKWEEIPLGEPIRSSAYVTSAALSSADPDTYLLGTSFSGLYITRNRGKTWQEYEDLTRPLYRGAGFLEEITSVVLAPEKENEAFIAAGFGNGMYHADLEREKMTLIRFPYENGGAYIRQIYGTFKTGRSKQFVLKVHTSAGSYEYNPAEDTWRELKPRELFIPASDRIKLRRLRQASDKTGIYLKSWNASGEDLTEFITFLQEHGMNSVVVDVKDDLGRVTYNTGLELPGKAGAVRDHIDMKELLKTAHEHDIYVIGRIVTFQDPKLYKYNNYKYAVWNKRQDAPWGHKIKVEDEEDEETTWVQREYWVDPFSEFAWDYNISIAEELQDLGIDEIQFDYIRFPSDGDMTDINYRYKKDGMRRIDAIESFLRFARERIHIPISTDLYGFNSWYRMGNWIGQNIEMVSHYVDVICPMYYPSHFPRDFLKDLAYFPRARLIYREGSLRSSLITEGRSVIRPYVQAFLLGGELKFEEPEYTDYLIQQLEGAREGLASGFTLWNNSNRYYMVTQSLKEYTDGGPGEDEGTGESTVLLD